MALKQVEDLYNAMTPAERVAKYGRSVLDDNRRADEISDYERGYRQGWADAMARGHRRP